jgi:hypothetical protein
MGQWENFSAFNGSFWNTKRLKIFNWTSPMQGERRRGARESFFCPFAGTIFWLVQ